MEIQKHCHNTLQNVWIHSTFFFFFLCFHQHKLALLSATPAVSCGAGLVLLSFSLSVLASMLRGPFDPSSGHPSTVLRPSHPLSPGLIYSPIDCTTTQAHYYHSTSHLAREATPWGPNSIQPLPSTAPIMPSHVGDRVEKKSTKENKKAFKQMKKMEKKKEKKEKHKKDKK